MLEDRITPATYTVNTLTDPSIAGGVNNATGVITGSNNVVSLRSAIQASNNTTGPNIIDLNVAGTYLISLPGPATNNTAGAFSIINNSVTILNTSGSPVTIDGGTGNDRVFDIANDTNTDNISVVIGTAGSTSPSTSITIQHGNGANNSDGGGGIRMGGGGSTNPSTLTLNNVIVTNNSVSGALFDGGGIDMAGAGILTLNNCTVSNNVCFTATGGGIAADDTGSGGTINVNNSTITGNRSNIGNDNNGGGGISVVNGRALTTAVNITNSIISGNITNGLGGGIGALGALANITIADSEFTGNTVNNESGGGVWAGDGNSTTLTVVDSTFDNNTSTGTTHGGGGIGFDGSTATLTNVTITGNKAAGLGGGIWVQAGTMSLFNCTINNNIASNSSGGGGGLNVSSGATGNLTNTIIAFNQALNGGTGPDIDSSGTLNSEGGNFIGTTTGFTLTNQQGSDQVGIGTLNLGPLTNNGGPTIGAPGSLITLPTEAELAGSTTIDTGVNVSGVLHDQTDERGTNFPRPDVSGTFPDIGAFEVQAATLTIGVTATPSTFTVGGSTALVITITNTSSTNLPDDNSTVTVTLPSNLTEFSAPAGATVNGNTITFRLGAVAANSSVQFAIGATGTSVGSGKVQVSVSSPDATIPGANPASLTVTVQAVPVVPPVLPVVVGFGPQPGSPALTLGFAVLDPIVEAHGVVVFWGDGTFNIFSLGTFGGPIFVGPFHLAHHYLHHQKHVQIGLFVFDAQGISPLLTFPPVNV